MTVTGVRIAVGKLLLLTGVVLLLFIPYLLWGTDIVAAQSQATLRSELARTLASRPVDHPSSTSPPATFGGSPALAPPLADPPVGTAVGTIHIPAIGLSMAIVEGTGSAELRMGPGHYTGTPLPGEAGNSAIAGHRTTYLRPFYSLNALRPGDRIIVATAQGTFTYRMTSSLVVSPDDVAVVAPSSFPELTLTTCNPRWSATQRLVVHARLAASTLSSGATDPSATVERLTPAARRRDAAALSGHGGHWPPALAWGAGVLLLAVALDVVRRRLAGGPRVAVLVVGALAWLGVLFFFFGAVGPLLPASF